MQLKNELYRAEVNRVYIDKKNSKHLVVEALIPEDIGGFYIREVGAFDQDGDLFAIARYPETYKPKLSEGTAKDLYIRMILVFSSTPNISLSVDNTSMMSIKDTVDFAKVADIEELQERSAYKDLSNVSSEAVISKIPSPTQSFISGCPVGVIFAYPCNSLPEGFLLLDGKTLGCEDSQADYKGDAYKNLYQFIAKCFAIDLITEKWNASEIISLPDTRSRSIIGSGQGAGLTHYDLLFKGGEESHILTVEEMPSHSHDAQQYKIDDKNMRLGTHKGRHMGGFHSVADEGDVTLSSGGDQPHNNMPPYIALNWIIKY